MSAYTETFLLEKSRLVSISANERNYHVFYLLLERANESAASHWLEKAHLKQTNVSNFRLLVGDSKDTGKTAVPENRFKVTN